MKTKYLAWVSARALLFTAGRGLRTVFIARNSAMAEGT